MVSSGVAAASSVATVGQPAFSHMYSRSLTWPLVTVVLLGAAGLARAQLPPRSRALQLHRPANYFPLTVGNSWTYTTEGRAASGTVTVRVTESVETAGQQYFRLEGFTLQPALVRVDSHGRLLEFRPDSGTEHLWYDFGAATGTTWMPELPHPCLGAAKLASRGSGVEVPAGDFDDVLVIRYGTTNCADAGIQEEVFAPNVGLIRRTETTIAGPRVMVLSEARVGSRLIRSSALSFSLSIDQPVYIPNLMPPVTPDRAVPVMRARMTIRNTTNFPLRLNFPSGQRFDLVIRDSSGQDIYRWSATRLFTQETGTLELSPGEKTFSAEIPLGQQAGRPLPQGGYVAEAWLTTADPSAYRASVSFEILEAVF